MGAEAIFARLVKLERLGRVALLILMLVAVDKQATAQSGSFEAWLTQLRQDAAAEGISAATLDEALAGLEPIPEVIERDRRQPESRLTFRDYNRRVLSPTRIERGRELMREHRDLLERVAADYGVQPRFIVALWGIESSYGSFTGEFHVVDALATLAYEGRRAAFFARACKRCASWIRATSRLRRCRAPGPAPWARASSCRRAISRTRSTTTVTAGATSGARTPTSSPRSRTTWPRPAGTAVTPGAPQLPDKLEAVAAGLEVVRPLPEWKLGIRRANGHDLPMVALDASLLQMDDGQGPSYLVYNNFRVLMAWNRSTYFAVTVGELADLIDHG